MKKSKSMLCLELQRGQVKVNKNKGKEYRKIGKIRSIKNEGKRHWRYIDIYIEG